ncbi:hypothetical protein B0H19DRAFT_1256046 [Mycena capillaripes]|nr:hypothetical protein B0H19DRAFT_1256046 [Mycena capillaripes]
MYKAGDPMKIFDPASLEFSRDPEELLRTAQDSFSKLPGIADAFSNPEKRKKLMEGLRERAAEREKSGETMLGRIMREKREWAEAAEKCAKLKDKGNGAFKSGDMKTAFVIYTACMRLSPVPEPLYPLNRAAVALKLKLYTTAVEDASTAIFRGDFNRVKAYFRRGQGRLFLGAWNDAEEDFGKALELQPGDQMVLEQLAESKRLRGLSVGEQTAWISAQSKAELSDIFGQNELDRRVEEVLASL